MNQLLLFRPRTILVTLGIINVIIIIVMQSAGVALKPGGIIAFEFAWSIAKAQDMIAIWQEKGAMPQLFFLLGFDYAFMLSYGALLFLGCQQVRALANGRTKSFFAILGALQLVAPLLDAIENYSLYQIAWGSSRELWPQLAFFCAAPKFAIALTAVVALLAAIVFKSRIIKPV